MNAQQAFARLTSGAVDVVTPESLKAKLALGRPLTVKVGFDPTAPDLHLGHTVLMRKMKHFQDLGHRVIFVIGDFTGMIGDPTGRSKTRPPLTREEIEANAETYKRAGVQDPRPRQDRGPLQQRVARAARRSTDVVRLARQLQRGAHARARRLPEALRRRASRSRSTSSSTRCSQAYDSVALKADVELGGTDQLFNLNVGRDIMPALRARRRRWCMTTPLLEGLDGVQKMSKTLGNYVGVTEPAERDVRQADVASRTS